MNSKQHKEAADKLQKNWSKIHGSGMNLNPGEESLSAEAQCSNGDSQYGNQSETYKPDPGDRFPDSIYSPSGMDVLGILLAVRSRPNPQFDLGPIDSQAPLIICDPRKPDLPICYVSESFLNMTGYREREVIDRNCRFLQHRPPHSGAEKLDHHQMRVNEEARHQMRHSMSRGMEAQVKIVNYKKNGTIFENLLTIVPVWFGDKSYVVGFQYDLTGAYWTRQ